MPRDMWNSPFKFPAIRFLRIFPNLFFSHLPANLPSGGFIPQSTGALIPELKERGLWTAGHLCTCASPSRVHSMGLHFPVMDGGALTGKYLITFLP